MKKFIAILTLALVSIGANAQHRGYYHHHGNYNWMAPLIVGGVVTYALTRPSPPPPPPQVIYVPQQPVYSSPPVGYRYEQILDANCSCYRVVLVPI